MTTTTRAWLAQRGVEHFGTQIELAAQQTTDVSLWSLLLPISVPITSESTVEDEAGHKFVVVGRPAERPYPARPQWRAASLRLISDMQA